LSYVARLYGEEIHILVGPGISSFESLRGQTISVPPGDGNAEFAVRDLLRRLRVEAEVIKMAAPDAIDDVRSGDLAALVLMGGKPLRSIASLPKDGSLRLLPLPFVQAMGDGYSPAAFRADDYPSLIPEGQTVDTISVSAVLVANNPPRANDGYRRIAKFVPPFFEALSELAGPQFHPKWSEVNLAANFAGWSRFAAAEEWLAKAERDQTASVRRNFDEFLSAARPSGSPPLSAQERKQLFDEFVQWTRKSVVAPSEKTPP
jgi:TRAP-type uncharacterized transport system substrate-binding protein